MKFKIKKGKHKHSNFWARLNIFNAKKLIKYKVKFDNNCWYPKINNDSNDLNKIFGFGGADHHKNSIRLCWRPNFENKGTISIFTCWYDDQKRSSKKFCDMKVGEHVEFEIKKNKNGFSVKTSFHNDQINHSDPNPTWKRLWPYFGGNNTAPHNMMIELK